MSGPASASIPAHAGQPHGQLSAASLGAGTWSTTYQYNLDCQLTEILRPDGQVVGFAYDAAGRPSAVSLPGGALGYSYEPLTGRRSSVSGPYGGGLGFSYDGSLMTGVTCTGEVAGSVSAAYDNDFRVTSLTVNGGAPVGFGYDGDGLLVPAGELGVRRDLANGVIVADSVGGITTSRTYTALGELESLTAARGADTLFRVTYVRDPLGRIAELTETVGGVTTTKGYTYDLAGRLTEARENGTVTAVYEYDGNGNGIRLTTPSGTITGTYDDQDRLVTYGAATYSYTRNGELSLKVEGNDTTRYEYDVLGNLRRVELPGGTVIDYVVDGLNRRIGKKVNGVLVQGWLYQDQLNPIAEVDGAGNVASRFMFGTRANVPDYMLKEGTTYRIVADHLGSVRLVIRTTDGVVMQRLAHDEFGRELVNSNPGFQPFGYGGGLTDAQTGLIRFGARDYDPANGRWTAKDTRFFAGGDLNLYRYVRSDPVNNMDPSGNRIVWASHVFSNPLVVASLSVLNQRIGQMFCLADDNFTIRVTGGDRYRDSQGRIRSATTDQIVANSSQNQSTPGRARCACCRFPGLWPYGLAGR